MGSCDIKQDLFQNSLVRANSIYFNYVTLKGEISIFIIARIFRASVNGHLLTIRRQNLRGVKICVSREKYMCIYMSKTPFTRILRLWIVISRLRWQLRWQIVLYALMKTHGRLIFKTSPLIIVARWQKYFTFAKLIVICKLFRSLNCNVPDLTSGKGEDLALDSK